MKVAITIASICIVILLAIAGILIFDIGRLVPSDVVIESVATSTPITTATTTPIDASSTSTSVTIIN